MTPRAVLERLVAWMSNRSLPPARPGGLRGAGWDWERLAERRLKKSGYRILERNFRARAGEIDFVAEEKGVVCFVEVKGRRGTRFGSPGEAVTGEKQRRIYRAAQAWLARAGGEERSCRFDVVSIVDREGEPRVEILRDAFQGPTRRRRRS